MDDPLSYLVRTHWDWHRDGYLVYSRLDPLNETRDNMLYGTGDFDTSWGAATKSILRAVAAKAKKKHAGPDSLEAGNMAPPSVLTDSFFREDMSPEPYARHERTAKKCDEG